MAMNRLRPTVRQPEQTDVLNPILRFEPSLLAPAMIHDP